MNHSHEKNVVTDHIRYGGGPYRVIQLYMHTKVFSTKVVSMHRASDTEPRNHQNLWGKPLLKKLDDETPKKVRVQTYKFFGLFSDFTV